LVLFPGAGSELYRGLGSVVLGGLVVSTIFTVVLVPTLFSLAIDIRRMVWSGVDVTVVDDQPRRDDRGDDVWVGNDDGRSTADEPDAETKVEGLDKADIFAADDDPSYSEW